MPRAGGFLWNYSCCNETTFSHCHSLGVSYRSTNCSRSDRNSTVDIFPVIYFRFSVATVLPTVLHRIYHRLTSGQSMPMFLNRRTATRYRALASIIPGRGRPEETTISYKISLVQLITNLNVILYLSTCHTVYITVLILFMIIP